MVIKQRMEKHLEEVEPLLLSVAFLVAASALDPLPPLLCAALFLRHFKARDREASRNCLVPSGSRSPWP